MGIPRGAWVALGLGAVAIFIVELIANLNGLDSTIPRLVVVVAMGVAVAFAYQRARGSSN